MKPNTHTPTPALDVYDILAGATLGFLLCIIIVLFFTL
jgi:hypothetical protein